MDPVTVYKTYKIASVIPWGKIVAAALVASVALFFAISLMFTGAGSGDSESSQQQIAPCAAIQETQTGFGELTSEQMSNAAIIASTAHGLGLSEQAWVIGISVGLTESNLRATLTEAQSDRDSFGLFQQRPPWGPLRTTAQGSAFQFFTGGAGGQPGLMDIAGWEQMSVGRAGQAVQRSAFPTGSNYSATESLARQIVASLRGSQATNPLPESLLPINFANATAGCSTDAIPASANFVPLTGATQGEAAVNAAAKWLGTPYSWGGGTFNGPSEGFAQGAGTVGFDCSGLILHAWYQGSAGAVRLPHSSATIAATTGTVSRDDIRAGDILSFAESGSRVSHDGIYDGRGNMIHAPRTGKNVEIATDILNHPYWSKRLVAITRP